MGLQHAQDVILFQLSEGDPQSVDAVGEGEVSAFHQAVGEHHDGAAAFEGDGGFAATATGVDAQEQIRGVGADRRPLTAGVRGRVGTPLYSGTRVIGAFAAASLPLATAPSIES